MGISIYPIAAGAININIGIIAPAVAVVLQDVPAREVSKKPSFIPSLVVDGTQVLNFQLSVRIPFIKPGCASRADVHPYRKIGIEVAADHGSRSI